MQTDKNQRAWREAKDTLFPVKTMTCKRGGEKQNRQKSAPAKTDPGVAPSSNPERVGRNAHTFNVVAHPHKHTHVTLHPQIETTLPLQAHRGKKSARASDKKQKGTPSCMCCLLVAGVCVGVTSPHLYTYTPSLYTYIYTAYVQIEQKIRRPEESHGRHRSACVAGRRWELPGFSRGRGFQGEGGGRGRGITCSSLPIGAVARSGPPPGGPGHWPHHLRLPCLVLSSEASWLWPGKCR